MTKFSNPPNQSKGILDDYAVRKDVATREGSVQKVPVNPKDIVNKEYTDAITPNEEERIGSELDGVSQATGRTLTLNNTTITSDPVMVFVEGQKRFNSSLTITHNASSSTITFDSVEIYDSDRLEIIYMGAT